MADYYMSITGEYDLVSKDPDHVGSSSTAADKIELRFDQTLSQSQLLKGLQRFERWIMQRGLSGAGASLPTSSA